MLVLFISLIEIFRGDMGVVYLLKSDIALWLVQVFRSSIPERTYIQILKTFQEEYLDKDILVKLYAPTENRQIYSKQTL